MTKKERREFARELARFERERQARLRRQRLALVWTCLGILAAGGLAGGGWALYSALTAPRLGPANLASDGLLLQGDGSTTTPVTTAAVTSDATPIPSTFDVASTGVLDIEAYLDPTTTDTATFWSTNGSSLESYLSSGYIDLELHVVAADPSDADSVAAASAFACVADGDPSDALAFWDAMVKVTINGLASGTRLNAAGLSGAASTAGITDEDVLSCITGEGYKDWAIAASERAAASVPYTADGAGAATVPFLVSAGTVYDGALDDTTAFTQFISDAYTAATATTTE